MLKPLFFFFHSKGILLYVKTIVYIVCRVMYFRFLLLASDDVTMGES